MLAQRLMASGHGRSGRFGTKVFLTPVQIDHAHGPKFSPEHPMTATWGLCAPGMRPLMRRAMPLDPHRRRHCGDPLVSLVPHLNHDITEIASCQPACADFSRRAGCRLHSRIEAVELGALVIAHERLPGLDIEIVTGHRTLRLASHRYVLTCNGRAFGTAKRPG